ncbi:acyl-CoA dehydrogenase family protein [Streptomyces melanogenes]|uniref:acyl-CoA dehydrogenase family protein n=1 Tax=Streptomyces melanogenes TaxID=67326 RepID=UPI00167C7FA2|nr:acyl-CoA dehydrogenase [Streptomyces melanogenes]GGP90689.1 putative acyl-CoA oxidase [Streptomyces melanogenes]
MSAPPATRAALHTAVHGDRLSLHGPLEAAFCDTLFTHTPAQRDGDPAHLAYAWLAHVSRTFGVDRACVRQPQRYFALTEWAAAVDPCLAALLAAHLNLCLGTLDRLGDSPEASHALAELESGRATGAFLATEAVYGSDLARLRTQARYEAEHDEFVLTTPDDGAVKFMPNNALRPLPKIAVVLARLVVGAEDRGVYPFLCPLGRYGAPAPGVRITTLPEKPGLPTDNALTEFRGARVPRGALLDGDGHQRRALTPGAGPPIDRRAAFARAVARVGTGRVGLSATSAAMARAAVTIAVRFARHRHSSGGGAARVPVIAHRVHHAALVDAVTDTYAASLLADAGMRLAAQLAAEGVIVPSVADSQRFTFTKSVVTTTCHEVLLTAQRLCGAHGMFSVNRIPQYLATNRGCMTAEGENTVITTAAVKEMVLGRGYDPPAAPPRALPALPLGGDTTGWLALARAREHHAHARCRRQLAAARREHRQFLDVWNSCAATAARFAERHGHRLVLEGFLTAEQESTDAEARHLLSRMAQVCAVRDLWQDAAGTLMDGLLPQEELAGLASRLEADYGSLAPRLPLLTDAFGIPGTLLDVPAATSSFVRRYLHPEASGTPHG